MTPISPPFLGGTQALLHDLALGLARLGHHVTVFAASGSGFEEAAKGELPGKLILAEVPIKRGELSPADFQARSSGEFGRDEAFFRQGELFLQFFLDINRAEPPFDIVHAHAFDWPAFALSPLSSVPVVHTVHLPSLDRHINAIIRATYEKTGSSSAVTVSKACARTYAADFPFDRVIYNGIDTAGIPFGKTGGDFLLFAGRMAPEKGPDLAIEIAKRAGKKLVLAGGIYDAAFFDEKIAPALKENRNLFYAGILERDELYRLMSEAEGLLFCSRWAEPFGLVLIETMATGTPVIAWRRGAAPEIVTDGETGFLLDFMDLEGAVRAIEHLRELDRSKGRGQVETQFSLNKMLNEYVDYYSQVKARIIQRPKKSHRT
ncbi:MAG: glycosyltransferase [Deltaproteobacteria bacterium]|nr:glycosyltransferase [Deltaproteobacteria bacterium]